MIASSSDVSHGVILSGLEGMWLVGSFCLHGSGVALSSSTGAEAREVSGTYGEEQSCPPQGDSWRGSFLSDRGAGGNHCLPVEPLINTFEISDSLCLRGLPT